MITLLDIKNFKCFKHLRMRFGALTLLTGFNGGGKSTAIQPLLLLSQALRGSLETRAFPLNGPLVHLGTAGDVLPSNSDVSTIEFRISCAVDEAVWPLVARSGDRFLRLPETADTAQTAHRALANLVYLSAVREGTADAYPIPEANGDEFCGVGVDGRFAAYWYDQFVDDEVPERRRHPSEPASSFRKQLDAWLGTLFPGAQANVQIFHQMSLLGLQFRLSEIGAWRRPANIGYGLSYAFPILVTLLSAREGQIIIIDSPEAHLHPSAQSQMGKLLAHFSATGIQIVVETHSDHLLNGTRLAVKSGMLPNSSAQIHFFSGANEEGHGVISLALDAAGAIGEWPEGFFDQSEKDLSRLTGWDEV